MVIDKAAKAMSTDCRVEGETAVLGESPMAKPANHDPSAIMVWPDSEPEYPDPVPEYVIPGSIPDPNPVPCEVVVPEDDDDDDDDPPCCVTGAESLEDFWLHTPRELKLGKIIKYYIFWQNETIIGVRFFN